MPYLSILLQPVHGIQKHVNNELQYIMSSAKGDKLLRKYTHPFQQLIIRNGQISSGDITMWRSEIQYDWCRRNTETIWQLISIQYLLQFFIQLQTNTEQLSTTTATATATATAPTAAAAAAAAAATTTTTTNILWPSHKTTQVDHYPQLRTERFCWSKVFLPACPC